MVLSDDAPYFQLSESLIGTNPGLGYRPLPEEPEDSGFIHYVASNKTEIDYWVGRLNHFTEREFETLIVEMLNWCFVIFFSLPEHVPSSRWWSKPRPVWLQPAAQESKCLCGWPVETGAMYRGKRLFLPWVVTMHFDQTEQSIKNTKLNLRVQADNRQSRLQIYGWVPEYYDDPENLPENMPQELKEYIGNRTTDMERKQIWITCNGVNPADNEAIGPISYYPSFGIPSYYFPFTNQPDYLSPLLAVQFQRPARKGPTRTYKLSLWLIYLTNFLVQRSIYVECRAWAKNIRYRGGSRDRQGSTQFSILID